jgi:hypothetical protein
MDDFILQVVFLPFHFFQQSFYKNSPVFVGSHRKKIAVMAFLLAKRNMDVNT